MTNVLRCNFYWRPSHIVVGSLPIELIIGDSSNLSNWAVGYHIWRQRWDLCQLFAMLAFPSPLCQAMAPSLLLMNSTSSITSMEWNTTKLHHTIHHPIVLLRKQCKSSSKVFRKTSTGTLSDCLAHFLLQYRITPHSTAGVSPSEMLFGRHLILDWTCWDRMFTRGWKRSKGSNRNYHDQHSRTVIFSDGGKMFVKNFRHGQKWLPDHIHHQKDPVSFKIELENFCICHRHQDHIRKRKQ